MSADHIKDENGFLWAGFTNEYQQRKLRCLEGPRAGEVRDDPRSMIERPRPPRPRRDPYAHLSPMEAAFQRGLDTPPPWYRDVFDDA